MIERVNGHQMSHNQIHKGKCCIMANSTNFCNCNNNGNSNNNNASNVNGVRPRFRTVLASLGQITKGAFIRPCLSWWGKSRYTKVQIRLMTLPLFTNKTIGRLFELWNVMTMN